MYAGKRRNRQPLIEGNGNGGNGTGGGGGGGGDATSRLIAVTALVIALLSVIGFAIWNGVQQGQLSDVRAVNDLQQMAIDELIMPMLNNMTADNIIEGNYNVKGSVSEFTVKGPPPVGSMFDPVWNLGQPTILSGGVDSGTCRLLEFILGGIRYGVWEYDPVGPSLATTVVADGQFRVDIGACSSLNPAASFITPLLGSAAVSATTISPAFVPLPPAPITTGSTITYHEHGPVCGAPNAICASLPIGSTWSLTSPVRVLTQISIP